jgi:hypothetical protein
MVASTGANMPGNKVVGILSTAVILAVAASLLLVPQEAASRLNQDSGSTQSSTDGRVPAYHAQAPKGELPTTMDPGLFTDPVVQNAYAVAAKIKRVLYQQPCYCHCDRSQGHKSLLDCFASKHGSGCGTCIYEDFYAYEQSSRGKSAAQIRAAIIKGEWNKVDAAKYQKPLTDQ